MSDLQKAISETRAEDLRRAHDAIKVAIDILKSAAVAVPVQLHLACHVLNYCLRPQSVRLERITIN